MESVNNRKTALRKELIKKRGMLSLLDWKQNSESIRDFILESKELKEAQRVHCYLSMNNRFEVDTLALIERLLTQKKEVIVPVTNFENGTLSHSKLDFFSELKKNKWGVFEPEKIAEVTDGNFDLIFVPLLAADRKGNRLGYGKGFYDRFLANSETKSFGLVFEEFILDEVPTEKFDVKLSGLISEKGIIYT